MNPPEDMHKVYCDRKSLASIYLLLACLSRAAWTIGYDGRFGTIFRLQQALMCYRPHPDDSQYTYTLDFCPIYK